MWGITAVTVAQNLREDGSLSPEYTFGTFIMQQTLQAADDAELKSANKDKE